MFLPHNQFPIILMFGKFSICMVKKKFRIRTRTCFLKCICACSRRPACPASIFPIFLVQRMARLESDGDHAKNLEVDGDREVENREKGARGGSKPAKGTMSVANDPHIF